MLQMGTFTEKSPSDLYFCFQSPQQSTYISKPKCKRKEGNSLQGGRLNSNLPSQTSGNRPDKDGRKPSHQRLTVPFILFQWCHFIMLPTGWIQQHTSESLGLFTVRRMGLDTNIRVILTAVVWVFGFSPNFFVEILRV